MPKVSPALAGLWYAFGVAIDFQGLVISSDRNKVSKAVWEQNKR